MSTAQASTGDPEIAALRRRVRQLERALALSEEKQSWRLSLADQVHRSLLPKPIHEGRIRVDFRYLPIEGVGGDYCQVRFSDRVTCYITMCDVTGHGIGPALLATRVSSEVRHRILYGREPAEIVAAVDAFVREQFGETGLYLTFVAAKFDLERQTVTWCGAGHPSVLLSGAGGGRKRELESQNRLLGLDVAGCGAFIQDTAEVAPGDRLLFCTDGIIEAADAARKAFGVEGLWRGLAAAASLDLFEVADSLLHRVQAHEYGPPRDDKTLIVAEMA